ncbi:hypothetical protein EJB05_45578, partial [Eragrostis curvula]
MALYRFRVRILSLILRSQPSSSASHDPPFVSLNRLLCSAATTASSASSRRSFAVKHYLVSRCGLTPAQANKAAKRISHLRSSSNPDAVLAFLGGTLGVPAPGIAAAVIMNPAILCSNVAKPNLALLQQCGLSASDITALNKYTARLFTVNPKHLQEAFELVEELGVKRETRMFPRTLVSICWKGKEAVTSRMQLLQEFGFSQHDVREIVRKAPPILSLSDQKVQGNVDFLMKDVGLDVPYIARRPVLDLILLLHVFV